MAVGGHCVCSLCTRVCKLVCESVCAHACARLSIVGGLWGCSGGFLNLQTLHAVVNSRGVCNACTRACKAVHSGMALGVLGGSPTLISDPQSPDPKVLPPKCAPHSVVTPYPVRSLHTRVQRRSHWEGQWASPVLNPDPKANPDPKLQPSPPKPHPITPTPPHTLHPDTFAHACASAEIKARQRRREEQPCKVLHTPKTAPPPQTSPLTP